MKIRWKSYLSGRQGLNTVEVVIILAIVVGIALVFKDEIGKFVRDLLDQVFQQDMNFNEVVPSSSATPPAST